MSILLHGLLPIDQQVTQLVQSYQPGWLTVFERAFGVLSAPELYVPLIVLFIVWHYRSSWRRSVPVLLVVAGNILTPAMKLLFGRPRPGAASVHVLWHFTGYSFPSGHALGAVLFTAAVLLFFWSHIRPEHRWVAYVVAAVWILLVGYCRVYLGAHWLSDVVAGYLIAGLWLLGIRVFAWRYLTAR
ncbi:MAG: phosphatase PAP2 family protein [Patescibacteria group bacterium]